MAAGRGVCNGVPDDENCPATQRSGIYHSPFAWRYRLTVLRERRNRRHSRTHHLVTSPDDSDRCAFSRAIRPEPLQRWDRWVVDWALVRDHRTLLPDTHWRVPPGILGEPRIHAVYALATAASYREGIHLREREGSCVVKQNSGLFQVSNWFDDGSLNPFPERRPQGQSALSVSVN